MSEAERLALLLGGLAVARDYELEQTIRKILVELKEFMQQDEFKKLVQTMFPVGLLWGDQPYSDLL